MRFSSFVLATCLICLSLPADAQELTGTLKKIKERGVIVLGVRDASVPFSYRDDQQKPVGYAIDICMSVVEAVRADLKMPGLKVETAPVISSSRIPLMANGTIDLECGNTTNNPDRQKSVAFTNTHFLSASIFVAKKADNLKTIDDLKGKTVVSTSGSTNIVQLNKVNVARGLGINVVPAKDHPEAFLMVETGRAAAYVMDDVIIAGLVAASKDPSAFALGDEPFSKPEPYGIMLRRDDPAFKAVVDRATAAFYASAEGAASYKRWFLSPIPPRGLNMNLPLSPALKYEYAHPTDSPDPAAYPS